MRSGGIQYAPEMDFEREEPVAPTTDGRVFGADFLDPALDCGFDDGTRIMLERQYDIGQFAVQPFALLTA